MKSFKEAGFNVSKERILLVEDEEDILMTVHFNLIRAGYRVECTTSGAVALRIAKEKLPDLII
ncbi:MAG: hypothetical protein C0614_12720, partial [Desulfuromonas sp.]